MKKTCVLCVKEEEECVVGRVDEKKTGQMSVSCVKGEECVSPMKDERRRR